MFSARVSEYQGNMMLNMCDAELLGRSIGQEGDDHTMHISEEYYGGEIISREKASRLLMDSSIINMVGEKAVSLATELGVGSRDGARTISNVPFLLIFKM
ncbi:MAG: DUF424 family protein [Thaumarchaeota archaeon]|nr:DUF424 family protein [Nitrososphaerota archaeon]